MRVRATPDVTHFGVEERIGPCGMAYKKDHQIHQRRAKVIKVLILLKYFRKRSTSGFPETTEN